MSLKLYPEFAPFWQERLLAQRVVLRWAGFLLIVHPNLKKKLGRMYYGGFCSKDNHGYPIPVMSAGKLDNPKDDLIEWGLGVKVVGGHTALRRSLRKKLTWAGLVEVEKNRYVVPKETIAQWIAEGTFVTPSDKFYAAEIADILHKSEDRGNAPMQIVARAMMHRESSVVGTKQNPGRSRFKRLEQDPAYYGNRKKAAGPGE